MYELIITYLDDSLIWSLILFWTQLFRNYSNDSLIIKSLLINFLLTSQELLIFFGALLWSFILISSFFGTPFCTRLDLSTRLLLFKYSFSSLHFSFVTSIGTSATKNYLVILSCCCFVQNSSQRRRTARDSLCLRFFTSWGRKKDLKLPKKRRTKKKLKISALSSPIWKIVSQLLRKLLLARLTSCLPAVTALLHCLRTNHPECIATHEAPLRCKVSATILAVQVPQMT